MMTSRFGCTKEQKSMMNEEALMDGIVALKRHFKTVSCIYFHK